MSTVHIVFGPQGAGKSTYSRKLSNTTKAIYFSIDEWMHHLFSSDLPEPIDFAWVMERVQRCETQIWSVASHVAMRGVDVILDLGFMKVEDRSRFLSLSKDLELTTQLHFVNASHNTRKARVMGRNLEKGDTFSFEVTPDIFDFMEQHFQKPTEHELATAVVSKST